MKHERKSCKSGSIKINSEDQRRVDTDRVVIGSENNSDRNRNLTDISKACGPELFKMEFRMFSFKDEN
jgi:hypothetical protein